MIDSFAISAIGEQWFDAFDSDKYVVTIYPDGILCETGSTGVDAPACVGVECPLVGPAHQYAPVEISLYERNVLVRADALECAWRAASWADKYDDVAVHHDLGHVAFPQLVECGDCLEIFGVLMHRKK
ncbi:Toluene-4-monooxygenase effector protein complex, benzene monooxygenase ferredoxin [Cupriavidus taiwanensis]|uniref:Toluene-4-monooxygenase effector protein complex, benzene monooxygenase ferredoxin n=3 Tax=Cupriavidus TaxID=106589 RepID=A0A375CRT0_9BURK|nr:Toluene-4-monooxygenase effector protein complex, benzene monooxygenase ferredoxin [Cupriavidus taiwanensis LMG 19424]SOY75554.1 Toluene-4-monooxygenase effector protein complex, benzene monooxygenase ferredoxin [Cupriavidus taiwanensis]SPD62462.1 Toluene-4-monooxygenase effector protein complex, benzene monooxygenase ferredoxin [Cupriavidus neocaledonicus]SOY75627.1 Toluene-4-monooxygenase effector protein complex, benzene monooxygenase ferredoxin [Cupriavidus taiwanensis]SOY76008.1 Toluene